MVGGLIDVCPQCRTVGDVECLTAHIGAALGEAAHFRIERP